MQRLTPVLMVMGAILLALPARAQLMLPGSMPQSAPTSVAPPAGSAPGAGKPRSLNGDGQPVATAPSLRPPGEDAVAGRQLQRNGATGVMAIDKTAGGLEISRLVFAGYQISRPADACRVEVGGGASVHLTPATRSQGLLSYDAELAACPFSLDILDGAARVRGKSCDFIAADCRVDPAGVWGPPGAGIGAEEGKNIEHARSKAESEARATFRALLAANKQNRARIKEIAHEQAIFSSIREEICRDYASEDKHGFCASRITMAHAVALSAELHGPSPDAASQPPARKKRPPKPKPVATAPIAPPLQ